MEDPGPGSYDHFRSEPKSFSFKTTHTSTGRKKVFQVKSREQKIGPGFYKYDNINSMNLLSQNKNSLITKFTGSPKK